LAAAGLGALSGFLVGAGLAIFLSGRIYTRSFPWWFWHTLAGTYGLSLGLAAVIRFRGTVVKILSLIAPPLFAILASWISLQEAGNQGLPRYVWFGTLAALSGAATGLLAGFSSRSVGGFVAGVLGGQLVAWPAGYLFFATFRTQLPYGLVVPMAFALASGLTHLAIAIALRVAKADTVPQKARASKQEADGK